MRATHGMTVQGTYVWSRSLALSASGYTNPAERHLDYNLATNHVTHDFRANGTVEFPFGPNRWLFGNSSGWVARLAEGWQTSFIFNANTGGPASIGAGNMLYGNGVADVVGDFSVKPFSDLEWDGNFGSYFGDRFAKIADPQCGQIAADLRPYCTLQAVTDARSGQILLQNPQPGRRGTLGQKTMELPGQWTMDAAMSKSVRISESKRLQIRVDATNVLNHPLLGNPALNINSTTPFGNIESKGNQRPVPDRALLLFLQNRTPR